MSKKTIDVNATVRIISTIKGKPLTETENFSCKVQLMPGVDYPADVLKAVVDTDVRDKFCEAFRERLKKVPALRNSIGGIKWSVDVSSIHY